MKNLLSITVFMVLLVSACKQKKPDVETTKQAIKELVQEAADSATAREYRLKNNGLSLIVESYSCKYFVGTMVKCEFTVKNPNIQPVSNLDVWYTSYSGSSTNLGESVALTEMDGAIKPDGTATIKTTMASFPNGTAYIYFNIKTGSKKYSTTIEKLSISEISPSTF